MGQALCKRTLNIVESLNEKHGDRLRFYLSKADEAGGESDRQVPTHWTGFVEMNKISSTFKADFFFLICATEGNDADRPGAVQTTRTEQMWFWYAHHLHSKS